MSLKEVLKGAFQRITSIRETIQGSYKEEPQSLLQAPL